MRIYLFILCVLFSVSGFAKTCFDCTPFYWGISGSFGAGFFNDAYGRDGNSFVGRLSLEAQYAVNDLFHLGLESGIQNGNTMRLAVPQETLDVLGGEPVHATIKPMVDILATLKWTPFNSGLFGYVKGGVTYRYLQVDINEVNSLTKLTPELQTGIGYGFGERSYISLGYQHFFGKNPNYQVNPDTAKGWIENIPSQDAILLGVTVLF